MTHDELLAKIKEYEEASRGRGDTLIFLTINALRAVVQFHKPIEGYDHLCLGCWSGEGIMSYPCPTIKAIEKELK